LNQVTDFWWFAGWHNSCKLGRLCQEGRIQSKTWGLGLASAVFSQLGNPTGMVPHWPAPIPLKSRIIHIFTNVGFAPLALPRAYVKKEVRNFSPTAARHGAKATCIDAALKVTSWLACRRPGTSELALGIWIHCQVEQMKWYRRCLREESMWPVCRRRGGKAQSLGSLVAWVKGLRHSDVDVMRKPKVCWHICSRAVGRLINRRSERIMVVKMYVTD